VKKTCKRCGVKGDVKEITQESTLKIISTEKVGTQRTFHQKSILKDVPTDEVGMRKAFFKSGPFQQRPVWVCAKCAKEIEEAEEKKEVR